MKKFFLCALCACALSFSSAHANNLGALPIGWAAHLKVYWFNLMDTDQGMRFRLFLSNQSLDTLYYIVVERTRVGSLAYDQWFSLFQDAVQDTNTDLCVSTAPAPDLPVPPGGWIGSTPTYVGYATTITRQVKW